MPTTPSIRFYFSFRSPYAWFAAERFEQLLAGCAYGLELVPIFPTPETFPNDPVRVPNKLRYVMLDSMRLAREYGLPIRIGAAIDTDWAKAHAAFLGAEQLGASVTFMREMFRARFCDAHDLGSDAVLHDVAERCGLPPAEILAAARSTALQTEVSNNFKRGQERDGIFGVPSFVLEGELFWGHDRLGALRRTLSATSPSAIAS
jgi:2-hydroxychromene-2-carboxylate isomerase